MEGKGPNRPRDQGGATAQSDLRECKKKKN